MNKKLTEMILYAVGIALLMVAGVVFTMGGLRMILVALLYFAEMEILLSIVRLVLHEPEPVKLPEEEAVRAENEWYVSRQDPAVMARMRPVGIVLCGVTFVLMIFGIIGVMPYEIHAAACLICFSSCVILCAVFPAYFSFSHLEGEKGRKCTFPIVNLLLPTFFSMAAGALRALTEVCFESWVTLLEGVLLTAAIVGIVMRLAVPELRRNTGNWIGMMILVLIFSIGLAMPLNHLTSPPPRIVAATVLQYNPGGYRNPADYRTEDQYDGQ